MTVVDSLMMEAWSGNLYSNETKGFNFMVETYLFPRERKDSGLISYFKDISGLFLVFDSDIW